MKSLKELTKVTENLVVNIEEHKGEMGFLQTYEMFKNYAIKQGTPRMFFTQYDLRIKYVVGEK